ncbi:MAG TPA: hypothetical protein VFQ35_09260, partial [Polyangiaceae bacterium]|nr:hypothetical protein [Polyangiaceae bacterium]
RDALPEANQVSVAGPEHDSSGKKTLAIGGGGAEVAEWYAFTRNVRDGVNVVTRDVLAGVWLVVHSPPSKVGMDFAEWGPYTDALDPAAYRMRVERSPDGTYLYRLEGRPRSSSSEADYVAVLTGKGYGKLDSRHGDGEFTIDLDAAKRLDPIKHRDDSGTVSITHDLPAEDPSALPRIIAAQVDPAGDAWVRIRSEAKVDLTGTLSVDAHADTDESKATAMEDISLVSRWKADGQGRADVSIAGGDLPAAIPLVTASECWNDSFARVYYSDSVGFKPVFGDSTACVYSDPAL